MYLHCQKKYAKSAFSDTIILIKLNYFTFHLENYTPIQSYSDFYTASTSYSAATRDYQVWKHFTQTVKFQRTSCQKDLK